MEIKSPPFEFCEKHLGTNNLGTPTLSLDPEIGAVFTNEFEIPFMGRPGTWYNGPARGTNDPLKACELDWSWALDR